MTNEHITRLEVSNFKKFDRLVVENIGQVNLITGDNNVGKTSLLEVLLLEPDMRIALTAFNYMVLSRSMNAKTDLKFEIGKEEENQRTNIVGVHQFNVKEDTKIEMNLSNEETRSLKLRNRIKSEFPEDAKSWALHRSNDDSTDAKLELIDNWLDLINNSNPKRKNISGQQELVASFYLDVKGESYKKYLNSDFDFPILKMEDFTISHHKRNKSILDRYSEIVRTGSTETKFITILNEIFPLRINAIRIGLNELEIRTQSQDEYKPISYFGDGFIKALKIVLFILRGNSPKVMIDEIDTGIHFSRLKSFWVNVLTLAKETNTQLFCTTHSQDCINAFVEAAAEVSEMKDKIRLIELEEALSEKSDRNVFASTYNFDQINAGLNSDVNLRGGKY
ncbi:MAG: AAA family ATPase [Chitinophagaceae bacterium]|jgi:AAA15 family ATPase/GTPase